MTLTPSTEDLESSSYFTSTQTGESLLEQYQGRYWGQKFSR